MTSPVSSRTDFYKGPASSLFFQSTSSDLHGKAAPEPPGVTDHGSSKARPSLVLVPGETDADREARCIVALQTLRRGEEHSPTALPRQVWAVLAENLAPGSLKPLLLRHPDLFWIADGAGHPWTFQVIGARHPPEEQPPEADGSGQPPTDGSTLEEGASPIRWEIIPEEGASPGGATPRWEVL